MASAITILQMYALYRECLVFVNNKLFSDRNWLLYGKCNFFNRTFFLQKSREVITCNNKTIFYTFDIFDTEYFCQHIFYRTLPQRPVLLDYKYCKQLFLYFCYSFYLKLVSYFELFTYDLQFSILPEIYGSVTLSIFHSLHGMNVRDFVQLKSCVKDIFYPFIHGKYHDFLPCVIALCK